LLQRLASALAINHGSQLTGEMIWLRLETLTAREIDVLCSILTGKLNKEIASELGINEKTIKVHRGNLMKKLGVQYSAQLFPMLLQALLLTDSAKIARQAREQHISLRDYCQNEIIGSMVLAEFE
jgi:DNA-binding NarL/FixJ family response regulator